MSAPRVPPSKAELETWLNIADHGIALWQPPVIRRIIAEIVRLRSMCGRAEPYVWNTQGITRDKKLAKQIREFALELRAASEGQ